MFRKLLVPLDGSELAEQALGEAGAIARACAGEINIVYVHEPMPFSESADVIWDEDQWKGEHRYVEAVAAEVTAGASVPVTHAVLHGEAVEMIAGIAADQHVDAVVMTSHGRTGLSRAWFGSIADGLLRRVTVPVFVLRPADGKGRDRGLRQMPKHLVVPLDGSRRSSTIVPFAAALAACADARLTLLRVVQPRPIPVSTPAPLAFAASVDGAPEPVRAVDAAHRDLSAMARRLREDYRIEAHAQVLTAPHAARAIIDYTREHGVDLVAMTTRGSGLSRLLVGSVADKIMRACDLPMLLFRPHTLPSEDRGARHDERSVMSEV